MFSVRWRLAIFVVCGFCAVALSSTAKTIYASRNVDILMFSFSLPYFLIFARLFFLISACLPRHSAAYLALVWFLHSLTTFSSVLVFCRISGEITRLSVVSPWFVVLEFTAGRRERQRGHVLLPKGLQEQNLVGGGQRGGKVHKLADMSLTVSVIYCYF